MKRCCDADRGPAIRVPVRIALSFHDRLIGLLRHGKNRRECAVLFPRCRAIHTIGMRDAIDVAFLDRGGSVVALHERLAPWRIAVCLRAESVLELQDGEAARRGLKAGDRLLCEVLR
ncbi:MAG TPA: DUF192 domain-containing protein [Burkholderiaceae bacterium]|jgi:uncharacterized protein|nr:DUF192 domain-containing protein [Burkholderiaceae bacterium]